MTIGISGRLVTSAFIRDVLHQLPESTAPPDALAKSIESWSERRLTPLGPAVGVRTITDSAIVPLLAILGYAISRREDDERGCWLSTTVNGTPGPIVRAIQWNESLSHAWREAVVRAVAHDTRWSFCCNGVALRIVDARRTWSREYLELDLPSVATDRDSCAVMWALLRADALRGDGFFERVVEMSARHALDVCRSLGAGVIEALVILTEAGTTSPAPSRAGRSGQRHTRHAFFAAALTVLYRVLFLLFAEARGLVPMWHPIYRNRYSLEAIVTALLEGRRYRGLWNALQAISQLAHEGCAAGELKVAPFNGRLFAPAEVAAIEPRRIDDHVLGRAVLAIGTTSVGKTTARARIVYRDLDVEQLGAVYEQVLDYEPTPAGLTRTRDVRKASGTFYTPRAVTAFLVERTLEPLVRDKSPDDILALRIVDPAMGSGAFLVAACRYLAVAVEESLVRDGRWHSADVTAADRVMLRREIASRCLYGVDVNPTAVQLARLSLWLATLAADKPLSFLDHHLVAGDSLIGATLDDIARQPSRTRGRVRHAEALPLFAAQHHLETALDRAAAIRVDLSARADDSVEIVRGKERSLAALQARDAPLRRLASVLDLWCGGWFWEEGASPDRAMFGELSDLLLRDRSTLPAAIVRPLLAHSRAVAERRRFLHWPLAFPEVFSPNGGNRQPGFDAVIGNPPWDMVRGDSGVAGVRVDRQQEARRVIGFVRESGVYRTAGRAHVNRYQLFVERALQLVRPGGRVGLVLPSGVVSDTGSSALRRHLFSRAEVDSVTGLDNRAGIFPIHRSVRFALVTCTAGRPTTAIACRFGLTRAEELTAPGASSSASPIVLSRRFLARLSGEDDLGIPEIGLPIDLRIIERITASVPRLGDDDGWRVQFGRELNATDDRGLFVPFDAASTARPVVEGKQIEPFRVFVNRSRLALAPEHADRVRVPRRPRLAYRDVASATNRLTLIAAVLPARAVTTHTLFCLKTPLPLDEQRVLCALLNSFVANYLIRLRVNTHVTASLVARLPVPVVRGGHAAFEPLVALSSALAASARAAEETEEYIEMQALAAHLYELSSAELEHVLGTFPLIPHAVRREVSDRFNSFH